MNLSSISIHLSYLLRHNSEDLTMDINGYVLVDDLINKLHISYSDLDIIVETDNKGRFGYSNDKFKLRALQGHTIQGLELDMTVIIPPEILYHGTCSKSFEEIKKYGHIDKMKRQYVHLTDNKDTAFSVGKRYSKNEEPIIIEIYALSMHNDGYIFKLSDNGVYQVDSVPIKYFK